MFRIKKMYRKLTTRLALIFLVGIIVYKWLQTDIDNNNNTSCDPTCLKLKYQRALVKYQEVKVETTNPLCINSNISPFSNKLANAENKFECQNKQFYKVVEIAKHVYISLNYNEIIFGKFYLSNMVCFIEKLNQMNGVPIDISLMGGKRILFTKYELYNILVREHG